MAKKKTKATLIRVEFKCDDTTEFRYATDLLAKWKKFKEKRLAKKNDGR